MPDWKRFGNGGEESTDMSLFRNLAVSGCRKMGWKPEKEVGLHSSRLQIIELN